jgi:hypothetical protein
MAQKKTTPASRAKSRVASRAKGQARAAASKTSAKQDRAAANRAYSKPKKVIDSGAGNIPVSVARAAKVISDYVGRSGPKLPSTKPRVSSDPMRNKNAPRKSNDELFNEYYKGRQNIPPKR